MGVIFRTDEVVTQSRSGVHISRRGSGTPSSIIAPVSVVAGIIAIAILGAGKAQFEDERSD